MTRSGAGPFCQHTLGYSGFKVVPANDLGSCVTESSTRSGTRSSNSNTAPAVCLTKSYPVSGCPKKEALKLYRKISSARNCMTTTVLLHGRMVGAVFFRGHVAHIATRCANRLALDPRLPTTRQIFFRAPQPPRCIPDPTARSAVFFSETEQSHHSPDYSFNFNYFDPVLAV